jgi:hypothetical protein
MAGLGRAKRKAYGPQRQKPAPSSGGGFSLPNIQFPSIYEEKSYPPYTGDKFPKDSPIKLLPAKKPSSAPPKRSGPSYTPQSKGGKTATKPPTKPKPRKLAPRGRPRL